MKIPLLQWIIAIAMEIPLVATPKGIIGIIIGASFLDVSVLQAYELGRYDDYEGH